MFHLAIVLLFVKSAHLLLFKCVFLYFYVFCTGFLIRYFLYLCFLLHLDSVSFYCRSVLLDFWLFCFSCFIFLLVVYLLCIVGEGYCVVLSLPWTSNNVSSATSFSLIILRFCFFHISNFGHILLIFLFLFLIFNIIFWYRHIVLNIFGHLYYFLFIFVLHICLIHWDILLYYFVENFFVVFFIETWCVSDLVILYLLFSVV